MYNNNYDQHQGGGYGQPPAHNGHSSGHYQNGNGVVKSAADRQPRADSISAQIRTGQSFNDLRSGLDSKIANLQGKFASRLSQPKAYTDQNQNGGSFPPPRPDYASQHQQSYSSTAGPGGLPPRRTMQGRPSSNYEHYDADRYGDGMGVQQSQPPPRRLLQAKSQPRTRAGTGTGPDRDIG